LDGEEWCTTRTNDNEKFVSAFAFRSLNIKIMRVDDGEKKNGALLIKFVSGGIAGIVAKTTVAPADRVKILFQVHSTKKFTLENMSREIGTIVKQDGIKALWRGNTANVLRVFPYAGMQFFSFDVYSLFLKNTRPKQHQSIVPTYWRLQGERLISGALAGATSVVFTYPLDLIRARMAVQMSSKGERIGLVKTFRTILNEGGSYSFFRGIKPTLLGILPYAGFAFLGFHTIKGHVEEINNGREILWWERLLAGSLAGLIAQSISYPLDMVRRRMQTERVVFADSPASRIRYSSIGGTLSLIYRAEGVRGIFKGLTMNWMKGPLAVGISFSTNDYLKKQFSLYYNQN
jgi:solute carrier family 25, member 42